MLRFLTRWGLDVRLLRTNPVFRTLFWGRFVATFGLGMLAITVSVQVYQLTGSSLQVALINSVLGLSAVAGSLAGGALVDRHDRRRVILLARGLAPLGFALLALNAMAPDPSLILIYVATSFDAAIAATGAAAFAAAAAAVVPAGEYPATGALLAVSIDVGAAASPLIAGAVMAAAGVAPVYWLIAFIGVLSWVVLWRLPPLTTAGGPDPDHAPRGLRGLRRLHGLRRLLTAPWQFARRDPVVGVLLAIGFIQIVCASPFVLIPEFVVTRFDGGEFEIAMLAGAPAVGALLAGFTSGWIGRQRRLARLAVLIFAGAALGVAAFGVSTQLWLAYILLGIVGAADVIGEILRFTLLSSRTPDQLRGRVTGLWQEQATVGDALGGPLLSLLARAVGPGPAIAVGGVTAAVLTISVLVPRRLRAQLSTPTLQEASS